MPTPHDYYDIHGMPRLHNVGEGRPYLENNYHADDAGPQVPSLSTIGRGPRGEGLKVGNVVNENGTVSFALYSDLTGELVWQSPNLDPGEIEFQPTDFRDLVPGSPAPLDILYKKGGVTKTTTAYLPCGDRGSLVYLLGTDRIARNNDDTYQTTVGDLVIYNHSSWYNGHKPIPRVNDIIFFSYRVTRDTASYPKTVRYYRGSTYDVDWDMVDEISDSTLGLIGFGFGTIEAVGSHNNEEVTPDTPVVFTARVFVPCYSELAEQERIHNEEIRQQNEADRVEAEQGRVEAEQGRVEAEQGRVEAEEGRVEAEETRVELYNEVLELIEQGLVNPLIVEGEWNLFLDDIDDGEDTPAQSVGDTRGLDPDVPVVEPAKLALYCHETAETMYEAFSAGRKVLIHVEEEDEQDDEQGGEVAEKNVKASPLLPISNSDEHYYEVIDAFTVDQNPIKLTKNEEDEISDSNLAYCFVASLPNINKMLPPGTKPFCLTTSFETSADGEPVFVPNYYDNEGILFVDTYWGYVEDANVDAFICLEEAGIMYEAFSYGRTVILGVHEQTKAAEDFSCWKILSAEYFYEGTGHNPVYRFTAAYLHDNKTNKLITSEYVSSQDQPYFIPPDDSSSSDGLVVQMHPEYIYGLPYDVVKENFIPCADTAFLLMTGIGLEPPIGQVNTEGIYLSLSMEYTGEITEAFIGTPEEAVAATDPILVFDWGELRIPIESDFDNPNDPIVFDLSLFDTVSERWHLYSVEIDSTGHIVTFSSDDPVPGGSLQSTNPALKAGETRGELATDFLNAAFVSDKTAGEIWEAYSNGGSVTFEWPRYPSDEFSFVLQSFSNIITAKMTRMDDDEAENLYVFEALFPDDIHQNASPKHSYGPCVIYIDSNSILFTDYFDASRYDDLIYFPNDDVQNV